MGLFIILPFGTPTGFRSGFKSHVGIKFIGYDNLCRFCFVILEPDPIADFLADFHGSRFIGTRTGIRFLYARTIRNRIHDVVQCKLGIIVHLHGSSSASVDDSPQSALAS